VTTVVGTKRITTIGVATTRNGNNFIFPSGSWKKKRLLERKSF